MSGTPKIVTLDIETAPIVAHVWGLRDQNVAINQIVDPGRVLGFGAKPLGKSVEWRSSHHDGHEQMIERAWQIMDEADVIIHFNGTTFDLPWLRREFVVAGMTPPSPVQQVDLLKVARRNFRLPSYKLQFISTYLGLEGKMSHSGHDMWVKCLAGDDKAWAQMRAYCKQDVALTEKLYWRLLPWIPAHPHLGLFSGEDCCQNCGGTDLERRGFYYTPLTVFQKYVCRSCGKWSRGAKSTDRADLRGLS